jgi:hypothetical protein
MKRRVVVVATIANLVLAKQLLSQALGACEPKIASCGGATRRVELTIDANEALEAGDLALQKLRAAFAEWDGLNSYVDLREAYVDEVRLLSPIDPEWEQLDQLLPPSLTSGSVSLPIYRRPGLSPDELVECSDLECPDDDADHFHAGPLPPAA